MLLEVRSHDGGCGLYVEMGAADARRLADALDAAVAEVAEVADEGPGGPLPADLPGLQLAVPLRAGRSAYRPDMRYRMRM